MAGSLDFARDDERLDLPSRQLARNSEMFFAFRYRAFIVGLVATITANLTAFGQPARPEASSTPAASPSACLQAPRRAGRPPCMQERHVTDPLTAGRRHIRPQLGGLSVKLRYGRALEAKVYRRSPGMLDRTAGGRLPLGLSRPAAAHPARLRPPCSRWRASSGRAPAAPWGRAAGESP